MHFKFQDTAPANTLKAAERVKDLKLTVGIITHGSLTFPMGCAGLAYGALFVGSHQVYPLNPGEYENGNGVTIEWDDYQSVKKGDHWTLRTYNEDIKYEHTVTLRLDILPETIAAPWLILKDLASIFKKLLGL